MSLLKLDYTYLDLPKCKGPCTVRHWCLCYH